MLYFMVIPWVLYLILKVPNSIHMLQQNTYNKDSAYLKWFKKNFFKLMGSYEIIQIIYLISLFFIDKTFFRDIFLGLTYLLLFIIKYQIKRKDIIKEPLVYTARVKRLLGTTVLFYILIIILAWKLNICLYLTIILLAYFEYLLILVVKAINTPIEKLIYLKYKMQAINKLKSLTNLKSIGITGSYGKTSSKNILSEILSIKYDTLPTPKNYNTPNGLLITINNHLNKFNEVFIAEMGARAKGEIKELCDLVHPTYGILTTIGTAHLESFGSQEVIQKTKFELIESLPNNGIGILNADDPLQIDYQLETKAKLIWIGINNQDADILAKNIKTSSEGITFDLKIKNDKKLYSFETKLLGFANVYNILAALALGLEFEISISDLQKAVKKVKPVEHRLELKARGDYYIIDDAYNSNPAGAKMALDVLDSMPGKKIIITSGMIELGSLEDEANKEYGEYLADICDEVILIGDKQTKMIQKGLQRKNYDSKHIFVLEDIKEAFNLVNELKKKETYVLLKNDLADIYK